EKASGGVRELLNALSGISVAYNPDKKIDDFVADNVVDMTPYGLETDKPATMSIEVKHKVGGGRDNPKEQTVTSTLLIGKPVDEKKEQYYARLAGEKNVVRVSAKALEVPLKALDNPNAYRNRDLANLELPKIDALEIKTADGSFRLRRATAD